MDSNEKLIHSIETKQENNQKNENVIQCQRKKGWNRRQEYQGKKSVTGISKEENPNSGTELIFKTVI